MPNLIELFRRLLSISSGRIVAIIFILFVPPFLFQYHAELSRYFSAFTAVERLYYDWKLAQRNLKQLKSPVAIISIGDKSIQKLGRFPFSRAVYSELIERLRAAQTKVLALDLLLSEPEMSWIEAQLADVSEHLGAKAKNLEQKLRGDFLEIARESRADHRLAVSASGENPLVVFGYMYRELMPPGPRQAPRPVLPEERKLQRAKLEELLRQFPLHVEIGSSVDRSNLQLMFFRGDRPLMPLAEFTERLPVATRSRQVGFFNAVHDSDGILRRSPLVALYQGQLVPSLSLAAASLFLNQAEPPRAEVGKANPLFGLETLWLRSSSGERLEIPIDNRGLLWVNYLGPPRTIPTYELIDVLEGRVEPGSLRGRLVFLGTTDPTLGDNKVVPINESFPGVEVHATLAHSILEGHHLFDGSLHFWLGLLFLTLGYLALSWVLVLASPSIATATAALVIPGITYLDLEILFPQGILMPTLWPVAQYTVLYFSLMIHKLFSAEQDRRFVELAFSRFVSASVADQILRDRSKLRVGGEKREMTVLFSDIAGFTELSESLDPKLLTEYLNDFFTDMTAVILSHRGTLDKYIGDAVMAFWGAPLRDLRHSEAACRTALAMQEALQVFNQRWQGRIHFETKLRIGINTGEMAVGNMGSNQVFDYTVLGDAVNLASRLEGVNRDYGSKIIVGSKTYQQNTELFLFRPLDQIQVRGRDQFEEIYELVGLRANASVEQMEWIDTFHLARTNFIMGRFDEAEAAFAVAARLKPDDLATAIYRERIKATQGLDIAKRKNG